MARFFVDELPAAGAEYSLAGENLEHAKVLRLKAGETVTLCDGNGMECVCAVAVPPGLLSAGPSLPCPAEPRVRVSVWIAFPKADKAEHVIQKAVELGAAELVLFPSHYCVSRPEGKALNNKLERWQKIARSAAEQSRRGVIPAVRAVDSYGAALREAAEAELPILFYENESGYSLHDALADYPSVGSDALIAPVIAAGNDAAAAQQRRHQGMPPYGPAGLVRISLMTGAEGGFSAEEIEKAKAAGMKICTLGPRILRCETAPLAGLTAVLYALGEI